MSTDWADWTLQDIVGGTCIAIVVGAVVGVLIVIIYEAIRGDSDARVSLAILAVIAVLVGALWGFAGWAS